MLRRQKVRKQYVAASLLVAALGGAVFSFGPPGLVPADGTGLTTTQRLMALLDARSPGERLKGELAASKLKRDNPRVGSVNVTRQRALGKVFRSTTPPPPKEFVDALMPVPLAAIPPSFASSGPTGVIFAPPSPSPIGVGGLLIPAAGGGGGGGGGVTPGSPGNPVSIVPSAVPEPSSWAMMLLGFGAIGFTVRRRRRLSAIARPA